MKPLKVSSKRPRPEKRAEYTPKPRYEKPKPKRQRKSTFKRFLAEVIDEIEDLFD